MELRKFCDRWGEWMEKCPTEDCSRRDYCEVKNVESDNKGGYNGLGLGNNEKHQQESIKKGKKEGKRVQKIG